ncbi:MAG: gamma-glutamyltransferase family protein, partial [Planctomycetota bacterium]
MLAAALLALAPQGAVASSQPDATAVGLAVLEDGGNAVDAAIAVHFALAVTYPYAGNLGGGGFLLVREADGREWFLDFRETAPAAAHPELYLREDGSLRLAAEGFRLDEHEAQRIAAARDHLARDPLAARIFLDAAGRPLPAGTLVRQPELAALLGRIAAEGEAPLREGPVVERLVAASAAGGGILAAADFRDYRPELREVVRLDWRGRTVLAAPPPSSGGIFLAHVLAGLEGAPLGLWGRDDARTVQLVGEATARAFALRNRWLGDPASMDVAPEDLLDPALLRARRRGLSPQVHTPPSRLGTLPAPVEEPERTTHFSVMDAAGGAVSCTTTLNGLFGAKVMAPDGFFLNNEMDDFAARPGEPNMYGLVQSAANAVLPGRRPLSSMCPVIVLDADGRVDAVVGSPGGPTILTTVLQVL